MDLKTRRAYGKYLSTLLSQHFPITSLSDNHHQIQRAVSLLVARGYLKLIPNCTKQLIEDLKSLPAKTPTSESLQHLEGVKSLPSVKAFLSDPILTDIVSFYLGCKPHLYDVIAWWQHPSTLPVPNTQLWHRDRDDFAVLKLFMYATDVDLNSGPHAFIPGSHTFSTLSHILPSTALDQPVVNGSLHRFLTDEQMLALGFAKSNFKTWLGAAGTCFLEDTFGFHRAYPPLTNSRLIFSVIWTVGSGWR